MVSIGGGDVSGGGGVGCPCRGRPKKTAGGGLGGRAQRLPPRCIRRTCCVIRFLEPWVHNFCLGP